MNATAERVRVTVLVDQKFRWLQGRSETKYSQWGEDGILRAIVERVFGSDPFSVADIGAHDGTTNSNTRALIESGQCHLADLYEPNLERAQKCRELHRGDEKVRVWQQAISVEGGGLIADPFYRDVLSIDIDGREWTLCDAMLATAGRPKILLVEHFDFAAPAEDAERINNGLWREQAGTFLPSGFCVQAPHAALCEILSPEYVPVAWTRTNTVFVRADQTDKLVEDPYYPDPGVDEQPEQPTGRRLNIGAGPMRLEGFEDWDRKSGKEAYPLDVPDNSIEEIYASHVFEHFGHEHVFLVLKDWVRALKPGGRLRVAVPDMDYIARQWLANGEAKEPKSRLIGYLFGGHTDADDHHGVAFDKELLTQIMRDAGLEQIKEWKPVINDCASMDVSLNLEGVKARSEAIKTRPIEAADLPSDTLAGPFPIPENPKVCFCPSKPRLSMTVHEECWKKLIRACGKSIDEVAYGGSASWEVCLTDAIYKALGTKADYLLFSDFDTVFDVADYKELLRIMQENPTIAAVFPVQMHRHMQNPICFRPDQDYGGELTDAKGGHFGLTLIRREVFEKMPEPWFWAAPDPDTNSWTGPKRLDHDMLFWRQLKELGGTAMQANKVVVGHCELAIIWPTKKGRAWQTVHNYNGAGKPPYVEFDPAIYFKERQG